MNKNDKSERVDIVDNNNRVLYSTTKQEAHKLGLLHQTVIAEIIDSKKRFSLVKQADDRQDAGQFVSPVGGHVQTDESVEDALKREALEEVGLKNFDYKYIGKVIFNRTVLNRQENHYFILFEIYSDDLLILNHEAVDYQKFTKIELKKAINNNPKKFGDAFYCILKTFYPELISK